MPDASGPDPSRHETEAERLDRNLTELLQELAGLSFLVFGVVWFVAPMLTRRQPGS